MTETMHEGDERFLAEVLDGSRVLRDGGRMRRLMTELNHLRQVHNNGLNFVDFVNEHWEWSRDTFGPSPLRWEGAVNHLAKEIEEIKRDPSDPEEWVDALHLVIDGMTRATGLNGSEFADFMRMKAKKVRSRSYPDWRTKAADEPVEHIRTPDEAERP